LVAPACSAAPPLHASAAPYPPTPAAAHGH